MVSPSKVPESWSRVGRQQGPVKGAGWHPAPLPESWPVLGKWAAYWGEPGLYRPQWKGPRRKTGGASLDLGLGAFM